MVMYWSTIVQQNPRIVVMLSTTISQSCFWPPEKEKIDAGTYIISNTKEYVVSNYSKRDLVIKSTQQGQVSYNIRTISIPSYLESK